MKKSIIVLLVVLAFVSCNPNSAPQPVDDILIYVENTLGENLFNPAVDGNILYNDLTINYNGETITMDSGEKGKMHLNLDSKSYPDHTKLAFGFFEHSDKSLKTFVINWGDGTSDEVSFEWHRGKKDFVYNVWLNGEPQSNSPMAVTIVK